MNSKKFSLENVYNNSTITLLFFLGTILFSLTMCRFIWSLEILSRLSNIFLFLFGLLYSMKHLSKYKYHSKIWTTILMPAFLIIIGLTINILISASSDIKMLSSFGSVLPWVVLLMVPGLHRTKKIDVIKLWKYSYYFMVGAVILGLFDYMMIIFFGGNTSILRTPNGVFLAGKFSLFHMLIDGTAHYRFYACFAEPGSLAMLLLPFIAYASYKKKFVGLIILLIGFYLTNSLGGFISGLIMFVLMSYFSLKKYKVILLFFFTITTIFLYPKIESFFSKQYEYKSQSTEFYEVSSAEQRERNFIDGIQKTPYLIFNKPLGIQLSSSTEENLKNQNYVGTNFLPVTYLQNGGLLAFIGYLIILYNSIKTALKIFKKYIYMTVEYKVVALSLIVFIPFLMQRTTIWETAWFALLYAPIIIDHLMKNLNKK